MVSVASFKSTSTQHNVHFINDGPYLSKMDDKAGYALGHGYLVIYNLVMAACQAWECRSPALCACFCSSMLLSQNFDLFPMCFQLIVDCNISVG